MKPTHLISVLAGLGAIVFLSGFALMSPRSDTPPQPRDRATSQSSDCFYISRINGFSSVDRTKIILRDGYDSYLVETDGLCLDLDRANQVGFVPRIGNSLVCRAYDADLKISGFGTMQQSCAIISVKALSAEDAKSYGLPTREDRSSRPRRPS